MSGTNLTGLLTTRTIGGIITEARVLLSDIEPDSSAIPGSNWSGTVVSPWRTLGALVAEARVQLNDPQPDVSATPGSSWSGTIVSAGHTLGALVAEVRGLIADVIDVVDGSLRYADADLYLYISDALEMVRRFRPDLFFNMTPTVSGTITPVVAISAGVLSTVTTLPAGGAGTAGVGVAPTPGVSVGVPVYTAANAETLFPIMDVFWPAIVSYVAATAEMRDDTWAQAAKGPTLLKGFADGLMLPPWRYSDAELYGYVSDALSVIRRTRPDLFFNLSGGLPLFTADDVAKEFPIHDAFWPAVLGYVVGSAGLRNETAQAPKAPALLKSVMEGLPSPPYRYSDSLLYAFVSDALMQARRLRPDMFLGMGLRRVALPLYNPATDAATLFPLDERYYQAFIYYVVGMALARNSELKPEMGASMYLELFNGQLSS